MVARRDPARLEAVHVHDHVHVHDGDRPDGAALPLRLPEAEGHAVALADGLVLRAVLIAEP
jgi:hypothetical protein